MLRNGDDQLVVREDREFPVLLIALDTVKSLREPIGKGKVDSFVEIELKRGTGRSAGGVLY